MTVKTPAELKDAVRERSPLTFNTTYTGPLGPEYALSGTASAPVGTHGAERVM